MCNMEQKRVRLLRADEIDCRVQSARTSNGKTSATLLLYKDARVDQRMLDEMYGPMNWQREHELIGDRLYCTVSVWDSEKSAWISKQDVGTESNTEPEKGQASDAFKRACFNWGIGRELYTAPNIRIELCDGEYSNDARGNTKVWTSFTVADIGYNDAREIDSLTITDRNGVVRYTYPATAQKAKPTQQPTKQADKKKMPADAPTNAQWLKWGADIIAKGKSIRDELTSQGVEFSIEQLRSFNDAVNDYMVQNNLQ